MQSVNSGKMNNLFKAYQMKTKFIEKTNFRRRTEIWATKVKLSTETTVFKIW